MKIMSILQKRSILEPRLKHAFPRPQFQKLLTLFLFLPPIPKILSFGSEWVETTFSLPSRKVCQYNSKSRTDQSENTGRSTYW